MTDDKLALAKTDLAYVLDHRTTARERLEDQRLGQPGSALGGGGGRGGGSPVETALGIGGEYHQGDPGNVRSDQAAHELEQADKLEKQLYLTARLLRAIYEKQIPKAPTDKQRRDVERANAEDPTCQHCTQHRPPGKAELVHRTGDVAGNLPEPMALCRWCYDGVRRTGSLPSKPAIQRHTLDLKPLRVRVAG